jgi:hypothetical protein
VVNVSDELSIKLGIEDQSTFLVALPLKLVLDRLQILVEFERGLSISLFCTVQVLEGLGSLVREVVNTFAGPVLEGRPVCFGLFSVIVRHVSDVTIPTSTVLLCHIVQGKEDLIGVGVVSLGIASEHSLQILQPLLSLSEGDMLGGKLCDVPWFDGLDPSLVMRAF